VKDITLILDIHPETGRRREKKDLLKSHRIEPVIALGSGRRTPVLSQVNPETQPDAKGTIAE
jgi:hypothetical protein